MARWSAADPVAGPDRNHPSGSSRRTRQIRLHHETVRWHARAHALCEEPTDAPVDWRQSHGQRPTIEQRRDPLLWRQRQEFGRGWINQWGDLGFVNTRAQYVWNSASLDHVG